MYMKVFGQQTTTDILPGQNVPHSMGGMIILVPKKNKYKCLCTTFLLKFVHNVVLIFTQILYNFF